MFRSYKIFRGYGKFPGSTPPKKLRVRPLEKGGTGRQKSFLLKWPKRKISGCPNENLRCKSQQVLTKSQENFDRMSPTLYFEQFSIGDIHSFYEFLERRNPSGRIPWGAFSGITWMSFTETSLHVGKPEPSCMEYFLRGSEWEWYDLPTNVPWKLKHSCR